MQIENDPTIKCIDRFIKADVDADIESICSPLKKWGINSFFYSAFQGADRINLLSNNVSWLNHLEANLERYSLRFENQFHYRPGFSIDYLTYFIISPMALDMIEQGMKNAIYLTNVSKDRKFSEVYIFTTPDGNEDGNRRLNAHLDLLNQFCFEFKDKASKIIQATRLNTWDLKACQKMDSPAFGFSETVPQCKRYYLGAPYDDLYLTHKELLYLKAYLNGVSCKAIANSFNLSHRSVETRLLAIKNKMDCKNKADILEKIMCSQLYYLIFSK